METGTPTGSEFIQKFFEDLKKMGCTISISFAPPSLQEKPVEIPVSNPDRHPDRIWLGSEHLLLFLYNLLIDSRYRFIKEKEVSWEEFKMAFMTGEPVPIWWHGTIVQLVCMIEVLLNDDDLEGKQGLIEANGQQHKLVQKHFRNKSGDKFELSVLSSSLTKKIRREKDKRTYDAVIDKLLKEWKAEEKNPIV